MKAVKKIRELEAEIMTLREQLARATLSVDSLVERAELSDAWRDAAQRERDRAGLELVDLDSEWRKLVLHVDGKPIRLNQWLRWAYRAYLDHTNQPKPKPTTENPTPWVNPTDDDWRRELGFWRKFGRFNPLYGAAPGEPGCRVPARLLDVVVASREESPPARRDLAEVAGLLRRHEFLTDALDVAEPAQIAAPLVSDETHHLVGLEVE